MIKRSKLLKRTPVRKKRIELRRGQATPEEVTEVRKAIYERSGGFCELRKDANCISGVLPWDGPTAWSHGHLVHLGAKRRYGTSVANSKWGCWQCHLIFMHAQGGKGKIIPKKEKS